MLAPSTQMLLPLVWLCCLKVVCQTRMTSNFHVLAALPPAEHLLPPAACCHETTVTQHCRVTAELSSGLTCPSVVCAGPCACQVVATRGTSCQTADCCQTLTRSCLDCTCACDGTAVGPSVVQQGENSNHRAMACQPRFYECCLASIWKPTGNRVWSLWTSAFVTFSMM